MKGVFEKTGIVFILSIFLVLASCSQENRDKAIHIFAAASMTGPISEAAAEFEEAFGKKAILNFAGSQSLATSIMAGARADIYISANYECMDKLTSSGYIKNSTILAKNRLTLCYAKNGSIRINSLSDLAQTGLILVTGEESVPAGSYFFSILDKAVNSNTLGMDEKNSILENIKSRELSVKNVLSKVLAGEADVGIVYRTDIEDELCKTLGSRDLPVFESTFANYHTGVLNASKNKDAAVKFTGYITGKNGKRIFKKHGFITEGFNRQN